MERISKPVICLANNALGAPPPVASGQQQFDQFCATCHGKRGEGGAGGPSLLGRRARTDVAGIEAFVKKPRWPMPKLYPADLDDAGVAAVAAHVRALQGAAKQ